MKRWVYASAALLLAVALLAALSGTAVAQQSRTRIAYLLAERIYVSGDVEIDDDLTVADDATVGGDLTVTGAVAASDYGAIAADSLSIADDMTLGGNVTIDGSLTSLGAPITTITTTGEITPTVEGVYLIASGGAAATVTLNAPASGYDGMRLTFVSLEATAHKVVADTVGFNAGDAANDTCTWSAAIGNSLEAMLYDGEWYVLNETNCTFD
jgi:hypothetical protein